MKIALQKLVFFVIVGEKMTDVAFLKAGFVFAFAVGLLLIKINFKSLFLRLFRSIGGTGKQL